MIVRVPNDVASSCMARSVAPVGELRETMGNTQEPGESTLQEHYLTAARSRLDESSWKDAWAGERTVTLEEFIPCALEEAGG